jgi:hypothetical protein
MLTIASILAVVKQGQDRPHFHAGGPYVPLMRPSTKEGLLASAAAIEIEEESDLVEEIVVTSRSE